MSGINLTEQEQEAIDVALQYLNLNEEDITTFKDSRENGTNPVQENRRAAREALERVAEKVKEQVTRVVNCIGGLLCRADGVGLEDITQLKNLTLNELIEIKKNLS